VVGAYLMDQNPLLDMLSDLDGKMRLLQRERNEAVARAKALEGQISEMVNLVGMVRTRVEKMLKSGQEEEEAAPPTVVQPPAAVPPPIESKDLERLDEFSPDPDRKWQKRLPPVSGTDQEPDLGASSI
jgi:hypothetical protein